MQATKLTAVSAALLLSSPLAIGGDATACMNCHDSGEFSGMSAADIIAAATDPGIPPHRRFADVSQEDLEAIAAELAGG